MALKLCHTNPSPVATMFFQQFPCLVVGQFFNTYLYPNLFWFQLLFVLHRTLIHSLAGLKFSLCALCFPFLFLTSAGRPSSFTLCHSFPLVSQVNPFNSIL